MNYTNYTKNKRLFLLYIKFIILKFPYNHNNKWRNVCFPKLQRNKMQIRRKSWKKFDKEGEIWLNLINQRSMKRRNWDDEKEEGKSRNRSSDLRLMGQKPGITRLVFLIADMIAIDLLINQKHSQSNINVQ